MEVGFTDSGTKMTTNTRTAFVVDEHSVFFYAGLMNEEELERGKYKIIFRFNDDGTVTLSAPDPLPVYSFRFLHPVLCIGLSGY